MRTMPLKYSLYRILMPLLTILLVSAVSLAYCADNAVTTEPDAASTVAPDAAQTTTEAITVTDLDIAKAALKSDWQTIADYYAKHTEDAHSPTMLPFFAYSYLKSGDKNTFLTLLGTMPDDINTRLLKAVYDSANGSAGFKVEGLKLPVSKVDLVVIKKNKPKGSASLGILPKSTASTAIKRAFDAIVPEPTETQLSLLDNLIETEPDEYFLGAVVAYEDDESAVCAAFVDTGKLKKEFNATTGTKSTSNGSVRVGIVTKSGSDKIRKTIYDNLVAAGYKAEDLGRGEFYSLGDRTTGINVVVEISAEAKTSGEVLGSKFKNIEGVLTLNGYSAVSGKRVFDLTERATVVSIDEFAGKEDAISKSYEKASRKLVGSIASIKEAVSAVAGGAAPVELNVTAHEVFASSYKYYATNSFGSVTIKNNSKKIYGSAEISFMIKGYMDYPTIIKVGDISPGSDIVKQLVAVFSEKILNLTDDSFLQSEVTLSYYEAGKAQKFSTNTPIFVYEKHALVWDDKAKIASFITPKDPVIVSFAGNAVGGYKDSKLNKNIVKARAVFAAMGAAGITYKIDPNNPFNVVSGLNTVVDYVQFPRETITRKVGDCDDLTSLYASALESMGIKTKLIDAPGHVFMMFNTDIKANEAHKFGFSELSYVVSDGEIWIPIETTLSGFSFTEAWKAGLKNYNKWKSSIKLVDLGEARKIFKSPNLGNAELKLKIGKTEIEKMFPGELSALEKEMLSGVKKSLEDKGAVGIAELMIINAEKGDLAKAAEYADALIKESAGDPVVLNNAANVYYLKGDYDKSIKYYKEAAELDKADGEILVNLSRAYLKKGDKQAAKDSFDAAMNISPGIKDTYYGVYMEVYK